MPDEITQTPAAETVQPAAPVTPAAAPVATPATPAAPVATTTPSTPVAAPETPKTEAAPVEAAAPDVTQSLLAEAKSEEPAPDAPVKEGDAPAQQETPADTPTAPKYEAFKLPEGITAGEKDLAQFTEILGKHQATQEFGQELVDLHLKEQQALATRLTNHQVEVFNRQQDERKAEFISDPEVGGNRQSTTLQTCASVIEQYGGNADDQKALRAMLTFSGAGNDLRLIKLFNRIGKALGEGRQVPASRPAPQEPRSKAQSRYGSSS